MNDLKVGDLVTFSPRGKNFYNKTLKEHGYHEKDPIGVIMDITPNDYNRCRVYWQDGGMNNDLSRRLRIPQRYLAKV